MAKTRTVKVRTAKVTLVADEYQSLGRKVAKLHDVGASLEHLQKDFTHICELLALAKKTSAADEYEKLNSERQIIRTNLHDLEVCLGRAQMLFSHTCGLL